MARTDHEGTTTQGLCFIAVENESDAAEARCAGPGDLDNMVLHLDVDSFNEPIEAFQVPDEAQFDLPEGWSQIRPNVVVITDPQNAPAEVEGQLPDFTGGWENFTLERSSS